MLRNLRDQLVQSAKTLQDNRSWRLAALLAIVVLALIAWQEVASSRHTIAPGNVPIAFWAWRSETPSEADLNRAVELTGTRTLFLRTGQIDYADGKLKRIRPVTGVIPRQIDLHLVYNGTRSFLDHFERVDASRISSTVLQTFEEDSRRAAHDGVRLSGLQLDFDVPTRLLPNYAEVLRQIRSDLPAELQLSITGLPTWMSSNELKTTLASCDFWIPQCYGARIPMRIDDIESITSPESVSRAVRTASALGKPFFAGLPAYGYAIRYGKHGELMQLRGDLNPELVVSSPEFLQLDQRPISGANKTITEWRTVYKARNDTTVDGTVVLDGESIAIQTPTASGLREYARSVRQNSAPFLLGICVFRLPTEGDSTSLSMLETALSLKDVGPDFAIDGRLELPKTDKSHFTALTIQNTGSASCRIGESALVLLIRLGGAARSVSAGSNETIEPVFEPGDEAYNCSIRRANALKVTLKTWRPASKSVIRIEYDSRPPSDIQIKFSANLDDGNTREGSLSVVSQQGGSNQ